MSLKYTNTRSSTMSRPVILVDDSDNSFEVFPSVTAAANSISRDPSTVHRAMTGDRGAMSVGDLQLLVVDFDLPGLRDLAESQRILTKLGY